MSDVLDEIVKKYGKIVKDGTALATTKPLVIPVSPAIDIALGGGIPEGSFCVFTGQPKCGKTTTSLWFAANAQRVYNKDLCPKGRNVYFFGVEGRLKPRDLQGIPHLDLSRFHQIVSEPGKILNAHEYLDAADMVIRSDPGCIVIIDSFSALCTEAEMVGGMEDQQRADGPKLLAKFCRKVANVVPVNKVTLIGITHLMANVTGKGAHWLEKSGQALGYQVDVKIHARHFELIGPEGGTPIGQKIDWKVMCSAIGGPGAMATSYIKFGTGLDEPKELVTLAIDLGIIEKKSKQGGWLVFADQTAYTDKSINGQDNMVEYLRSEPALFDKLRLEVYATCGVAL